MRDRSATLLLLTALFGGCASVPRHGAAAAAEADAALRLAATQVQRCYRTPRVSFEGRQIATRLRIRLSADGQVAELPVIIVQNGITPANQNFAPRMAEAAIAAVMRCAPIRLPPGFYSDGRAEFDLTFSPLARS
ncbi:MAG: cell envelope integrity protein TolA [Allosphingosinicella sp.]